MDMEKKDRAFLKSMAFGMLYFNSCVRSTILLHKQFPGSASVDKEIKNIYTRKKVTHNNRIENRKELQQVEIKINDYYEPHHFRALNEANYDISRSCEYEKNEMHHIHESTEILFVETGSADYYINGKKYYIEPGDILIIGSREHHMRRLDKLPFLRYGLAMKPSYYASLNLGDELTKVYQTPGVEDFKHHFKNVDPDTFQEIIHLLQLLYGERDKEQPFRGILERSVLTEITVMLYRLSGLKKGGGSVSSMHTRMQEIKEYIDLHYKEELNLDILSREFFLHPVTISKEFNKSFGCTLTKYINNVRVCEGARLLEVTQDSITSIALQCGYDSVNTFLRQFKAVMETTPLQYRKGIRKWFERSKSIPENMLK